MPAKNPPARRSSQTDDQYLSEYKSYLKDVSPGYGDDILEELAREEIAMSKPVVAKTSAIAPALSGVRSSSQSAASSVKVDNSIAELAKKFKKPRNTVEAFESVVSQVPKPVMADPMGAASNASNPALESLLATGQEGTEIQPDALIVPRGTQVADNMASPKLAPPNALRQASEIQHIADINQGIAQRQRDQFQLAADRQLPNGTPEQRKAFADAARLNAEKKSAYEAQTVGGNLVNMPDAEFYKNIDHKDLLKDAEVGGTQPKYGAGSRYADFINSPEFKGEVLRLSGGDKFLMPKIAREIADQFKSDPENAKSWVSTTAQQAADKLYDSGPLGKAVYTGLQYPLGIARGVEGVGNTGASAIQSGIDFVKHGWDITSKPSNYFDNLRRANENRVVPSFKAKNESGLTKIAADAVGMAGDIKGAMGLFSNAPKVAEGLRKAIGYGTTDAAAISALESGKTAQSALGVLSKAIRSQPAKTATKIIDDAAINHAAFGLSSVPDLQQEYIDQGFTEEQAFEKANKKALLQSLAFAATGFVPGKEAKKIDQLFGRGSSPLKSAVKHGLMVPAEMTAIRAATDGADKMFEGGWEQLASDAIFGVMAGARSGTNGKRNVSRSQKQVITELLANPSAIRDVTKNAAPKEQANAIAFVNTLQPYYKEAVEQRGYSPEQATLDAMERATMDQAARKLQILEADREANTEKITSIDQETGQPIQVNLYKHEDGQWRETPSENLTKEYDRLKKEYNDARKSLVDIQNGVYGKEGQIMGADKMQEIAQMHSPEGRLRREQIEPLELSSPYEIGRVDISNYAKDPEIVKLIEQYGAEQMLGEDAFIDVNPVIDREGNIIDGKKAIAAALYRGDTDMFAYKSIPTEKVKEQANEIATEMDVDAPDYSELTDINKDALKEMRDVYDQHLESNENDVAGAVESVVKEGLERGYGKEDVINMAQRVNSGALPEPIIESFYNDAIKEGVQAKEQPIELVAKTKEQPSETTEPAQVTSAPKSWEKEMADLGDIESYEKLLNRAKTGEPIEFEALRIQKDEKNNLKDTGVFFGDKFIIKEYKEREDSGFFGEEHKGMFDGGIQKYNVKFDNPLVIRNKFSWLQELAKAGDKEVQEVMPNYENPYVFGTTHDNYFDLDSFVARKAKELGYDGIITPLEYIALKEGTFTNESSKPSSAEEKPTEPPKPKTPESSQKVESEAKETEPAKGETKKSPELSIPERGEEAKKKIIDRAVTGKFADDLIERLEKEGVSRNVQSHVDVAHFTDEYIDKYGLDVALEAVKNKDIDGAEAVHILNKGIRRANDESVLSSDPKIREEKVEEAAELFGQLDKLSRRSGQAASYLQAVFAEEGTQFNVEKYIDEERKKGTISDEEIAQLRKNAEELKESRAQVTRLLREREESQAREEFSKLLMPKKKGFTAEKAKVAADNFRKAFKSKDVTFIAEDGKEIVIQKNSLPGIDELVELGAKAIEKTGQVADALRAIKERIKKDGWYSALTDVDKRAVDRQIEEIFGSVPDPSGGLNNTYLRQVINTGVKDFEEFTNRIKQDFPGTEDSVIHKAISKYGAEANPTKGDLANLLSKYKSMSLLASKIADAKEGKVPLRSPFGRQKPDVDVRELQRQLDEAMRNLPEDAIKTEDSIATPLDRLKNTAKNRIEDLNKAIEKREKIERKGSPIKPDAELAELQSERDRLQDVYDNLFYDKKKSAGEKKVAQLDRKLDELRFGKDGETDKVKPEYTEEELQDIDRLEKEIEDFKDKSGSSKGAEIKSAQDKRLETEQKAVERLQKMLDKIRLGEIERRSESRPKTQEELDLLDEIAKAKEMAGMTPAKLTDEEKAVERLDKLILDVKRRIRENELEATKKDPLYKYTAKYRDAQDRLGKERAALQNLREEAGIVEKERLAATKKAIGRRITELNRRIEQKDFEPKERKPIIEDTELTKMRAEAIRLSEELDKIKYKHELENRTTSQKIKDFLKEAWGIPRSLRATGEMSFVGIQGLVYSVSHPKLAIKAAKNAAKFMSLKSGEENAEKWLNAIKAQDWYPVAKQSKLAITEPSAKDSAREEAFVGNWTNLIWDKILGSPTLAMSKDKQEWWRKKNPFKSLERGSVGYLDTIRIERFLDGMKLLEKQGKNPKDNPKDYSDVADLINTLTGRASIGKFEPIATTLSNVFFSPRLWASQIKTSTPYAAYYFSKLSPTARKMALRDYGAFVGATAGLVATCAAVFNTDDDPETSVEFDPRSSDFGKIKLGNIRIDPWGGRIQDIILTAKEISGQMKDKKGDIKDLGSGPFTPDRFDLLINRATGKLAPAAGIAYRFATKKEKNGQTVDKYGKPYSLKKDISGSLYPIYHDTIADLIKDKNSPAGLDGFLIAYALFGGGVNVYDSENKK